MSKFKNEEMNNHVQDEKMEQHPPLVQDVRTREMAAHHESLNEQEYLKTIWGDMKTMFNMCDFESRRNEQRDADGNLSILLNRLYWPVIPSQLYEPGGDLKVTEVKSKAASVADEEAGSHTIISIGFSRRKFSQYKGSFKIRNAIMRARFIGDENCHSFYIGEYDMLSATVLMGPIDDEGTLIALMMDGRTPKSVEPELLKLYESGELWKSGVQKEFSYRLDTAELEEFTMLAVTDGRYYKNYMEPRAINEDLAIFTHYNKARNLLCDTVASFKDGLVDPETIFTDTGAEDIPASWANNQ